jgi:hypothetical protein
MTPYKYENKQDAAHGLLLEVATLLNKATIDYVVVGGWVPYLFHSDPLRHPGTFDVDIVLNDRLQRSAVSDVLDVFRERGYLPTPKNPFQIFRVLNVGDDPRPNRSELLYHVDLLHRMYADGADGMKIEWGEYESIQGPGTDVIFLENEKVVYGQHGTLPSGEEVDLRIPFATEVGMLSCKGRSIDVQKRTRDAYDVFLLVRQARDRTALIQSCKRLCAKSPMFKKSLEGLSREFRKGAGLRNAVKYLAESNPSVQEPGTMVETEMQDFFKQLGL